MNIKIIIFVMLFCFTQKATALIFGANKRMMDKYAPAANLTKAELVQDLLKVTEEANQLSQTPADNLSDEELVDRLFKEDENSAKILARLLKLGLSPFGIGDGNSDVGGGLFSSIQNMISGSGEAKPDMADNFISNNKSQTPQSISGGSVTLDDKARMNMEHKSLPSVQFSANTLKNMTATDVSEDALSAFNKGRFEVSADLYQKAMQKDGYDRDYMFGMGVSYHKLNQTTEAMNAYGSILKHNPQDIDAINNLTSLINDNGNSKEAMKILQKLEAVTNNNPVILSQLGNIYAENGDNEKGIRYLKMALEGNYNNPLYAYNLGIMHERLNKNDMAIKYYNKAIQNMNSGQNNDNGSQINIMDISKRIEQIRKNT
jgi:tetratricopeptide (TPR) repeat protein